MAEFTEVIKEFNRLCIANITDQGVCGGDCPFFDKRGYSSCNSYIVNYCSEAEKIIMNWAKEHPAKTNRDKFKEVFGAEVDNDGTCCAGIKCQADYRGCINCEYNGFWDKEYIQPKEV